MISALHEDALGTISPFHTVLSREPELSHKYAAFGFGELHICSFSLTRKFPASCRNAQVEYGRRQDVGSQGNSFCHKEKQKGKKR